MATEASPEIPAEPATPPTCSDTLNYYFTMENALYKERVRDADSDMAYSLHRVVEALRCEMTSQADARGVGKDLRSAMSKELAVEERTLWIRMAGSELKDTRLPHLLSASLLLGCAVSLIAYTIYDLDWSPALLSGLGMISLGFCLPWFVDKLAEHEERKLRELRRVDSHPDAEWWTEGSTILRITYAKRTTARR
jgi:hypothetical protein